MQWECRHASAEMLYVEVRDGEVLEYFDHHPDNPTRWSFEQVLAGELDGTMANLFGEDDSELKAAVAAEMAARR